MKDEITTTSKRWDDFSLVVSTKKKCHHKKHGASPIDNGILVLTLLMFLAIILAIIL